jgi:hypothetical protein
MKDTYKQLFSCLSTNEPSDTLLRDIMFSIRKEQVKQRSKRLIINSASLFLVACVLAPFSWHILVNEVKSSSFMYFVSVTFNNFGVFLTFWKDFLLAILESMPVVGLVALGFNLVIFLLAFRFLLSRRNIFMKFNV